MFSQGSNPVYNNRNAYAFESCWMVKSGMTEVLDREAAAKLHFIQEVDTNESCGGDRYAQ